MTARRGISMVEILVSIALFGVSAVGLARLATMGGRRGMESSGTTQQAAILLSEFSRQVAIPAAVTPPGTTCDTVPVLPWQFERCTRVTNVNSREQRVAVVVRPLAMLVAGGGTVLVTPFRPDSLWVVRAANVGALDLAGTP